MRKLLLLFILFTTGCAAWIQTDGPYISKSHKFSAELPQGWMRLNKKAYPSLPIYQRVMIDHLLEFPNGDSQLCITRDGISITEYYYKQAID